MSSSHTTVVDMILPDSENSLWRESYPKAFYAPLQEGKEVDAVIVGAGITGLTAAYLLKKSGLTVYVLEKDTVGGGTTGRTTGKVSSQHSLAYADLYNRLGEDAARAYAQANQAGLEQIAHIIEAENIVCDWQREDNYVFTAKDEKMPQLYQEAAIAKKLGLPVNFAVDTPLPFSVKGAVVFKNQAKMDAQKYVLGLAEKVHGNGSGVYENSTVIRIQDGNPGFVKTKSATVYAKYIIVATSVPTLPLAARGTYCLYEYPTESYIVAGPTTMNIRGMYISPDTVHYSILPITLGGRQILLVGGKSHIAGLNGSKKSRYQKLAQYAKTRLGVTEVTHRWSDRDYIAYDKLPLVGKLYPNSKKLYVASAFRKWGLTNSTAAALILHDLIIGKPNAWAAVFTPHRKGIIGSIPRTIQEHLPFMS